MITVFYAGLVYGRYESWPLMHKEIKPWNDVYQGGFVYVPKGHVTINGWYTCDGCPKLSTDVPPALQAWLLLLE